MTAQRLFSPALFSLAMLALTAAPAKAQVGRGCSVFNQCRDGYSCQPVIQKCYNSPRREGQPCSAGFSCGSGLRCAPGVQQCVKINAAPTGVIEKAGEAISHTSSQAVAAMQCPNMQLKCPTGESFERGTSWDGGRMMCSPSAEMSTTLAAKCPRPYAGNSSLSTRWDAAARKPVACSAKWDEVGINVESQYSAVFNDACVIHDLCYRTARTQAPCDLEMLANMQAVCYKLDVLMAATAGTSVATCLNAASIGYAAVVAKGKESYDGDQKDFQYPAGGGPAAELMTPAWTTCATEGGTCSFSGTRRVRYGANGSFVIREASNAVGCNNDVFGDPIPGVVKQCAYSMGEAAAAATVTNVARGRRAVQSSTEFDGTASRAVDGGTDGTFNSGSVTHTGNQANAWWMVDLGAVYSIERIVVYNRTDCCQERLSAFVAVTATEGWPSGSATFQAQLGSPQARMEIAVGSRGAVSGRYVYVVLNGANYLSLAEVEVMGTPR